jgi:hypothetical protein
LLIAVIAFVSIPVHSFHSHSQVHVSSENAPELPGEAQLYDDCPLCSITFSVMDSDAVVAQLFSQPSFFLFSNRFCPDVFEHNPFRFSNKSPPVLI